MNQVRPRFRDDMLALLPELRGYARSLTYNQSMADDLVQEAMVKAWESAGSFTPGTNMRAWMFTILRNSFYTQMRKRKREVEDIDGAFAATLTSPPGQVAQIELAEFKRALGELNAEQREALILVGASGFSYEEAAEICGCAVGTIKSRVNRARRWLTEALEAPSPRRQAETEKSSARLG